MRYVKIFIIFLIILFFSQFGETQKLPDSVLIKKYLEKGDEFQYKNLDSALYYYNKAQQIAIKGNCKDKLANILNYKAIVLMDNGRLKQAYLLLDTALKIATDTLDKLYIKNNLATLYDQLKMHQKAFLIYKEQMKYFAAKKDTYALASTYTNLSLIFQQLGMFDSSVFYLKKSLNLDLLKKDTINLVFDYYNLANIFFEKNQYDSAKIYLDKSLELAQKINLDFILGSIYAALANYYENNNDFEKSLNLYKKAIEISKKLKNYEDVITFYSQLVLMALKFDKLQLAKVSLDSMNFYYENFSDKFSLIQKENIYKVRYEYFKKTSQYDSALWYFEKYIELKDSLNLQLQISKTQIFNLQLNEQKIKQEIERYKLEVKHRRRLQILYSIISLGSLISLILIIIISLKLNKTKNELYQKNKKLTELIEKDKIQISLSKIQYLALAEAKEHSLEELLKKILKEILNQKWLNLQPKGAIFLKDDTGNLKLVAQINLDEVAQKCKIIKPDQCLCGKAYKNKEKIICQSDDKDHKKDINLEQHGHFIAPIIVEDDVIGLLNLYLYPGQKLTEIQREFLDKLVLLLSLIIDRRLKREKLEASLKKQDELNQKLFAQSLQLEEEKHRVEQASKKIEQQAIQLKATLKSLQDSITYASYMLQSLLPSEEELKKLFKEYFLIFKPVEKIGGDFYFASQIENKIYLAVGDATGHGVPGAILSAQILGYLYEIIQQHKICEPKEILTSLRNKIKSAYQRASNRSIQASGVDIGLCVIDTENNYLGFSGANIPLYLIRDGQLFKYKPTRSPVGRHIDEKPFEQYIIELKNNDILYLQSDGFIDQLNDKLKKFARKRYEQLLIEIHSLPLHDQKDIILKVIDQWKGNMQQTDDILIFALKWII